MPATIDKYPLIATVIVGNGWTHARANRTKAHFPSVSALSQKAFSSIDLEGDTEDSLTWDETAFVWGEAVYQNSRLHAESMGNEKTQTVTYKRLLIGALYKLFGAVNLELDAIVTTFPVLDYENNREKMRSMIAGLYHLSDQSGREFSYKISSESVKILPEGLPTIYDMIYNENLVVQNDSLLKTPEGKPAKVGVCNVGTFTTDLILVENQKPNAARSTSLDYGLSTIWQQIRQYAKKEHGKSLTLHESDKAMKDGFFYIGNKPIYIQNILDEVGEQLAESISNEINGHWDSGKYVNGIIFAGGGAPQLNGILSERYTRTTEVYTYGDVVAAASTEMNGCDKFARIKLKV